METKIFESILMEKLRRDDDCDKYSTAFKRVILLWTSAVKKSLTIIEGPILMFSVFIDFSQILLEVAVRY